MRTRAPLRGCFWSIKKPRYAESVLTLLARRVARGRGGVADQYSEYWREALSFVVLTKYPEGTLPPSGTGRLQICDDAGRGEPIPPCPNWGLMPWRLRWNLLSSSAIGAPPRRGRKSKVSESRHADGKKIIPPGGGLSRGRNKSISYFVFRNIQDARYKILVFLGTFVDV